MGTKALAWRGRGRADPHKTLNDGSTALHKAREAGHVDVVRVLEQAMSEQVYEPSREAALGTPPIVARYSSREVRPSPRSRRRAPQ